MCRLPLLLFFSCCVLLIGGYYILDLLTSSKEIEGGSRGLQEATTMANLNEKLDGAAEDAGKSATSRQDGVKDISYETISADHALPEEKQEQSHTSSPPDSEGHVTDEEEQHDDEEDPPPIRPTTSRASSIFSRGGAAIIPRNQRRGLFGRVTVIPEIERPYDYTPKTKWAITAIVALAAAAAPMGSGIFYRMFFPNLCMPAVFMY